MNIICQLFGHKYKYNPSQDSYHYSSGECTRKNCHCSFSLSNFQNYEQEVKYNKFRWTFWTSDLWNTIKVVFAFLLVIVSILALVLIPGYLYEKHTCDVYAKLVEVPVQWNLFTNCMAKHPQFGWMPIDEFFRNVNVTLPK